MSHFKAKIPQIRSWRLSVCPSIHSFVRSSLRWSLTLRRRLATRCLSYTATCMNQRMKDTHAAAGRAVTVAGNATGCCVTTRQHMLSPIAS